ncbi:DUF599 family protein [Azospirillum sp. SYSU D00513]|uniref:DUF599 family protein n=1 Tax=Azospirillum sp. SYSU D00513 TaxID=2812561 RepID=UPI001A961F37
MPPDLTLLDACALAWFLTMWIGYKLAQDHLLRGRMVVNQHLRKVRVHWMERMLDRDNRIMDSQLVGHTINSCTFFASTTILILAGLLGSFGAIEHAHEILTSLTFTVSTSRQLFEIKMALLVLIFTFGFFKFTWALRQYNYCCALLGSAPLTFTDPAERRLMAENIADALTLAITALNDGLRAYYFALAGLSWMIHPWLFIIASGWVVLVLLRRQAFSGTEKIIRAQLQALERHEG